MILVYFFVNILLRFYYLYLFFYFFIGFSLRSCIEISSGYLENNNSRGDNYCESFSKNGTHSFHGTASFGGMFFSPSIISSRLKFRKCRCLCASRDI